MKTYVLYHANCQDGLGAKYAAWKKFGDRAIYIPVQYGQPLPEISSVTTFSKIDLGEHFFDPESGAKYFKQTQDTAEVLTGGGCGTDGLATFSLDDTVQDNIQVFILDFSYPRDVLEELRSRVDTLVILDHHKTAKEALEGFEGAVFDMNKSGAVLAWEYFHPGVEVPQLLLHIQDRDLWQFRLQGTQELTPSLYVIGDDMQALDAMADNSDTGQYFLTAAIQNGSAVLRHQAKQISNAVKNVVVLPFKGYKVGVLNTTTLVSEIGTAIYTSPELDVDFSMSFFIDKTGVPILSFRSSSDKEHPVDVSALAAELGGGGHRTAAGAKVSLEFIGKLYKGEL